MRVELYFNVLADGMPQTQKFHIVVLDKSYRAQIIKLVLAETQLVQVIDLLVYLLHHFLCKYHILIAAFEMILSA